MYTKVFRSIYDGTLADNWQAMVTFQQMLILADSQGVVDMTLGAMARITGIPLEILAAGISVLEAPDAGSRTPEMEGRRIARLDAHRDWGWFLVNFAKYRAMQTREEKNEADRERMRNKRGGALSGGVRGKSCEYCGGEATGVDHIIPTSAGGLDVDGNVVACCLRCNASKNSRPLLTFLNDPLTRADRGVVLNSSKLMGLVAIDEKSGLFVASCRQLSPVVAGCIQLPSVVADVAHTDLDTDLKSKSVVADATVGDADKPKKSDRLTAVTEQAIAAFNSTLSVKAGGLLSAVTMCSDKRKAQVKRTVKLAAMACERLYGSPTVTPEFWVQYFEEVGRDDFKSGRGPYVNGHANWRPDFEYLTRPEVVEKVIDDALSRVSP